jgi:alpha-L-rhamnosidase
MGNIHQKIKGTNFWCYQLAQTSQKLDELVKRGRFVQRVPSSEARSARCTWHMKFVWRRCSTQLRPHRLWGFRLIASCLFPSILHALAPTTLTAEFLEHPVGLSTLAPRLSWLVRDTTPGAKQTAYRLQAASSAERLATNEPDLWDSGKVDSAQSHLVGYEGKQLSPLQKVWWRVKTWDHLDKEVAWSEPAAFEVGLLDVADWAGAQWVSAPHFATDTSEVSALWIDRALITDRIAPGRYMRSRNDISKVTAAVLLRREFELPERPVRARLYIATLGYHEVMVNGSRVDDHRMEPAASHADLFSYYVVKDLRGLLQAGRNCVGMTLSNGRFVEGPRHEVSRVYGEHPATKLRLVAEFDDGSTINIVSDESWRAAPSPTLRDSFWIGEAVDARRIPHGWEKPGFGDAEWLPVVKAKGTLPPKTILQAFQPERVTRRVKPVRILNPVPDVWVFDMGEALVGNAELRVAVPRGTLLTLRYSEDIFGSYSLQYYSASDCYGVPPVCVGDMHKAGMLAPKRRGTLTPTSANDRDGTVSGFAVPTDVFCAAGGGEEVFERRFGYRPFRYVELTGYPGTPNLDAVTGLLIHNDLARTGSFACSDTVLTEIADAGARTVLYLLHGMQQDNAGAEKGNYPNLAEMNFRIHAYRHDFAAMAQAFIEQVREFSGKHNALAFHLRHAPPRRSSPIEGPTFVTHYTGLPWQHFLQFGDRRPLERNYFLTREFVRFWFENPELPGLIRACPYGDHVAYTASYDLPKYWKGETCLVAPCPLPREYVATVMGYKHLGVAIAIAEMLNESADAERWRKLQAALRGAIVEEFVDPLAGGYCPGAPSVQAVNALAITSGLSGALQNAALADGIVRDMKEKWNGHLSTGSAASYALLEALSGNGHFEEAFRIMARRTYPSLGHMLSFGSRTIGEAWEFPDAPPRNSHIQAEGWTAMTQWFYDWLCGVRPDSAAPGFKHFFIQPHCPEGLNSAGMEFQSVYGRVATSWEKQVDGVTVRALVPWNTSATVRLPQFPAKVMAVNGAPCASNVFTLPAGKWEITIKQ